MDDSPRSLDRLTLIAITAVAYILANGVHEGIGHGGACVLLGRRPVALSTVFFELISAVAAAFGSTPALAWMTQLLRNQRRFPPSAEVALSIPRSWAWVVVATLTVFVFIVVLGPSIRF